MKIGNITDIEGFFRVLDNCVGRVELLTSEGDRLNLKSKLCQYVALSKMFHDATIDNIEIIAYESEDLDRLFQFIYRGKI